MRDKEQHAAAMRAWRAKHPENVEYQREYHRRYYADPKNGAIARQRAREWHQAHPQEVAAAYRARYVRTVHPRYTGPDHVNWKGEAAAYTSIHSWVRRHRGAPQHCDHCGTTDGPVRRYHWANVDHQYRRVLEDYMRLCQPCHYKYDVEHGLQPKLDNRPGRVPSERVRSKR